MNHISIKLFFKVATKPRQDSVRAIQARLGIPLVRTWVPSSRSFSSVFSGCPSTSFGKCLLTADLVGDRGREALLIPTRLWHFLFFFFWHFLLSLYSSVHHKVTGSNNIGQERTLELIHSNPPHGDAQKGEVICPGHTFSQWQSRNQNRTLQTPSLVLFLLPSFSTASFVPVLPKAAPQTLPAEIQESSLRIQAQNQGEFTILEI